MSDILELDHVNASYSTYRALFDVSFAVPEGSIVALLGSNGAGKSTVARVASGLLPTTSGRVIFDGAEVTGEPAHRIARLGLFQVPEGRGVFASLTVEENLLLSFRRRGKADVGHCMALAFQAFPVLRERRRQAAGTLSGGQQRILSLAKVFAHPGKLLIVDELSLGLAPIVVDAVYEALVAIRDAGSTLLVVEQQIDRALAIADHAVVLAHGAVAWIGPASAAGKAMEGVLASTAGALGEG